MRNWIRMIAVGLVVLAAACGGKDTTAVPPDTTVTPPPPPPPATAVTLVAAGNISKCTNQNDEITAQIIDTMTTATVLVVGNAANPGGLPGDYTNCYDPTWGRFKARTYGVIGNHDYDSLPNGDGFFGYFGQRGGQAGKGFYSFDVGAWHVIVLNTENATAVPYAAGSEQQTWLAGDLAANAGKKCTMVAFRRTRYYSSATPGGSELTSLASLWSRFAAGGVDVVINSGQYFYERMAPMSATGVRDDASGMRQFNVGTGGESLVSSLPTGVSANSEKLGRDYGVLRLTLRADSYDWRFVSAVGGSFTDSGTGTCH